MSDLIINKEGDIEIYQVKEIVSSEDTTLTAINDLASTEKTLATLIRRAIETPRGYIGQPVISTLSIEYIDNTFGSDIYRELSEGITLNFLARVKTHIINSLNTANLGTYIDNVMVNMTDAYTVSLDISYTNNIPNTQITFNIQ